MQTDSTILVSKTTLFVFRWGNIKLHTTSDGVHYIELKERQTKTQTGANIADVREKWHLRFMSREEIMIQSKCIKYIQRSDLLIFLVQQIHFILPRLLFRSMISNMLSNTNPTNTLYIADPLPQSRALAIGTVTNHGHADTHSSSQMSRHVDQSSNSFSSSQILAQSTSMFYGATLHIQNFNVYMQPTANPPQWHWPLGFRNKWHVTVVLVDDVYIMLRLLLVVDFLFYSKLYLINKYTLYHFVHALFLKRRKST
jgi:hypothetical protein